MKINDTSQNMVFAQGKTIDLLAKVLKPFINNKTIPKARINDRITIRNDSVKN